MNPAQRRARVMGLVQAARRVDCPPLRARLVEATGLSPAGVELALREHLETHPTDQELASLLACAGDAPVAHVVLSANVFTAGLRALCLAAATAPSVRVRCSTREEVFAPALIEACDCELRESFRLVESVAPSAGDEVHLYGSDESLESIRAMLPAGVKVRAHGTGLGIAMAREGREDDARLLARDIVPFDQRGCLSPRVVFVRDRARAFATALAEALRTADDSVPRGRLSSQEQAENVRFRDTAILAGELFEAGAGTVAIFHEALWVAPVGRNMAVIECEDPAPLLPPIAPHVAAIGGQGEALVCCPGARISPLGQMQKPPLDGPVDKRPASR